MQWLCSLFLFAPVALKTHCTLVWLTINYIHHLNLAPHFYLSLQHICRGRQSFWENQAGHCNKDSLHVLFVSACWFYYAYALFFISPSHARKQICAHCNVPRVTKQMCRVQTISTELWILWPRECTLISQSNCNGILERSEMQNKSQVSNKFPFYGLGIVLQHS